VSEDIKPTAEETALWNAGKGPLAVRALRARTRCGLREALDILDPTRLARGGADALERVRNAAPDLLAVLQSLRDVYSEHMATLPDGLQTAIREAIAKAEGRT